MFPILRYRFLRGSMQRSLQTVQLQDANNHNIHNIKGESNVWDYSKTSCTSSAGATGNSPSRNRRVDSRLRNS